MLLLRLHRLALRLRPLLPLCYGVGGAGAASALVLLFWPTAEPELLSLALAFTVWALMLYAFILIFQSIPPPVLPSDDFVERFLSRCRLALYHVLAFGVVILAVVLVSMSLKLLTAGFR